MNNIKTNSTMETQEPDSYEALKSDTNTEIIKNNLNSEGSEFAHTNVTLQDLSPIRFHRVYGEFIKMSNDFCTARLEIPRDVLYKEGQRMVFSSSPIAVDQKVFLRVEKVPNAFKSSFTFGFTYWDPKNKPAYHSYRKHHDWTKSLQRFWVNFNDKDIFTIFHFCVKRSGEVCCGINDTDIEFTFKKINTNVPLWAVIELCDKITSLKLIDYPSKNESEELKVSSLANHLKWTTHASTELGKTNQKEILKEVDTKPYKKPDLDGNTEENEGSASTALGRGSTATSTNVILQDLPPLRFHRVHGECIKMSKDYCTARLEIPDLSVVAEDRIAETRMHKSFVICSRPIAYGEKVYLRLKIDQRKYLSSLVLSFRNYDPYIKTKPKSQECYNVANFNLFPSKYLNSASILYFCVKQPGEVIYCLKDDMLHYCFHKFNISGPLWAVLYLPHYVTEIKFINSPKGSKSEEFKLLSKAKHIPAITNDLVELNNLIGNVNNLKHDSTMAKEKSKSYKALKPIANIEKIKNSLNAEGRQVAHSNVTLQDLSPIRFHRVHGKYVKMSYDYCTALKPSECIVFSSRPIAVDEKVFLRLEKVPKTYQILFSLVFTHFDPSAITAFKYPDRYKSVRLYWDNVNDKDIIIIFHFSVKPTGEVWCGINNTDMGVLFEKININVPLWAVIEPIHNVTSLNFTDGPNVNETEEFKPSSLQNPSLPTTHALTELSITDQKQDMKGDETKLTLDKKANLDEKTEENERSASTALKTGSQVAHTNVILQDLPVRFHKIHGMYIKMSDDYCNARPEIPDFFAIDQANQNHSFLTRNECIVFSSRPIAVGEKLYVHLKIVPRTFLDLLGFGLTNCDPNSITDLKSWNCYKWLQHLPKSINNKTNILCFCVKQSGEVTYKVNDDDLSYWFQNIYISGPLWVVLKLPHNVTNVEISDSPEGAKSEEYKFFSEEKPLRSDTNALGAKEEDTGTSSKNTKNEGADKKINIPADNNILTEKLRTDVTSITKGQSLFDWGVESSVISEPEFKKTELKSELTVQEAFKLNLQHSTNNSPAKPVQPTSYADVKYTQNPGDCVAIHFAKIVEYHLNRVSEDKRLKCMQKILGALDNSFK